ncbi:MAG: hypothetical protein P1U89_20945 [Verrucomicrobiales bacterium]|nr:hypothetical protein [Verrucomicrobiales bacterium]
MNHEFLLILANSDGPNPIFMLAALICYLLFAIVGLLIGWIIWKGFNDESSRLQDENRRLARILNTRETACLKYEEKAARLSRKG